MTSLKAIKKHEINQTRQISTALIDIHKSKFKWRVIVFPFFIYDTIGYCKRIHVLRKNLFFTKRFALEASKNIHQGKDRAWEFRQIEIKTGDILNKEKKGFYTDKIRSKQLREIDFLIDHYLDLLSSNPTSYTDAIRVKYTSKGSYLNFLNKLQKVEEEVIQAAISTMRKGTKKERRLWFDKIRSTTRTIRLKFADEIYAEPIK
ncbi:MAG: NF038143 family protein [Desulfobacterales bacterium]|jgi:hypothetical protein